MIGRSALLSNAMALASMTPRALSGDTVTSDGADVE